MTENEAIKRVEEFGLYHAIGDLPHSTLTVKAFEMAIKALQEIQQYRAIGTVEECQEARERQRAKKPNIITGKTEKDKLACCPICERNLDWTYDGFWRKGNPKYCSNCGQAIDWRDTN